MYTVCTRTTAEADSKGVTAFAVPGDAEGLSGEPLDLLAPHAMVRAPRIYEGTSEIQREVIARDLFR